MSCDLHFKFSPKIINSVCPTIENLIVALKICPLSDFGEIGLKVDFTSTSQMQWSQLFELLVISFQDFTTLQSKSILNLHWFAILLQLMEIPSSKPWNDCTYALDYSL